MSGRPSVPWTQLPFNVPSVEAKVRILIDQLRKAARAMFWTPSERETRSLREALDPFDKLDLPPIVCLCGSARFRPHFERINQRETLAGKIVLTMGVFTTDTEVSEAEKIRLDELHLRKIDLADEVFVINVGGYVGESTAAEILYAREKGKPIRFLEPLAEAVRQARGGDVPERFNGYA